MASEEEKFYLAIDIGSSKLIAGWYNIIHQDQIVPYAIIPNVVGRLKYHALMDGVSAKDYYIGDEAMIKRGILNLASPITSSTLNKEDLEHILFHVFFNELRLTPSYLTVIVLTGNAMTSKENREKAAQILFEQFDVQNVAFTDPQLMALVACG